MGGRSRKGDVFWRTRPGDLPAVAEELPGVCGRQDAEAGAFLEMLFHMHELHEQGAPQRFHAKGSKEEHNAC